MAVVAQGVVELIPSAKGFSSKLQREIGGDLAKVGDKQGKGLGGKVAAGFGFAAKAGFAGAGALAAGALTKGFGRLKSIDDAEGKLKGLGHSSKTVDGIMKNALGSVKGTAFGLDEAATTAAGSVAAGIKPGKDLEDTLSLVADAATIGGTSMSEMGGIFNKVASSNKVQGDVINQLNERGIPIVQMLAKEMGVTEEEVYALSQAGKIGFDDFRGAMESGLGGAAKEGGKTFSGAMANAGAALGRLGASFLSGVFPQMKTGLNELTGLFDRLGPTVEAWGAKLGAGIRVAAGGIGSFISNFRAGEGAAGRFRDVLSTLWSGLRGAAASAFRLLLPHLKQFGSSMAALLPSVVAFGKSVGTFLMAAFRAALPYLKIAAAVIGVALVAAMKALPPILQVAMAAFRGILAVLRPMLPVIAAIGAALLTQYVAGLVRAGIQSAIMLARTTALRIAMAIGRVHILAAAAATRIHAAAQKLATLSTLRQTIAEKARAIAMKVGAVATKAMAIAQRILNAAMRANPIGLLITGLLLLGAGLVLAYKKSETFRRIVNAAWAGIKAAASATVSWFRSTAWPWMKNVFTQIGNAAKWLYRNAILPAWRGIRSAVSAVVSWVRGTAWPWMRAAFQGIARVAKWLWNNAIKPYWRGIKASISVVVSWIRGKAWPWIRGAFRSIARVAEWLGTKVIRPVWRGIRAAIRAVVEWIRNTAWPRIRGAFQSIAKVAKWLYGRVRHFWNLLRAAISKVTEFIRKQIVSRIRNAFGRIQERAAWLRSKVRDAWNRLQAAISKVTDFIRQQIVSRIRNAFGRIKDRAEWMRDKIRAAFDRVKQFATSMKDRILNVRDGIRQGWSKITGYITSPLKKALGWLQRNFVGKLRGFIGKIPGVSQFIPNIPIPKGWARGGWTGAGSTYQPAGIVHADEFVVKKSSRRKFERDNPGALDHINRFGRLPQLGYAKGGLVGGLPGYARGGMVYQDMARWFKANFPNKVITSSYRPGSRTAASNSLSYHARGKALDMSPSMAIFNKIKKTFGTAIRELIYSPAGGRQVHNGRNHRYTGITRAMHFDHVHWAMNSMKNLKGLVGSLSGGGGFFDLPDALANPLKWAKDKIASATSGFKGKAESFGIAGKVFPAVFDKVQGAVKKQLEKARDLLDFGGGGPIDVSGIAKGPVVAQVQKVAKRYGWGSGSQWDAIKWIVNKESSWNPKAANPTSSARGLFQKMTHIHGPVEKTAAGQANWGLNYIRCVPLDTEILTRRGWLAHDEVQVGDETIGYDPATGAAVWTRITHVHHYEDAPVTRLSNSRWESRSTPNHRWVTEKYQQRVGDYGFRQEMTQTQHLGTRHRLVLASPHESDTKLDITPKEAELLGWVMGDGNIYYGRNNRGGKRGKLGMSVAQTKPKYMAELRECLSEIPHSEYVTRPNHWSANEGASFRLRSDFARDLLERSGYERDPEAMVLGMSQEQREAFFRGFMFADGHVPTSGASPMFSQNEGWKLDVALLTMYLLGHYGNPTDSAGHKHVTVGKATVKADFREEVLERQAVWCVTTEADTWTMRQGGRVMLTGNSRYGSPTKAQAFWRRNNWYAKGTDNARSGLAVVGENGPELVRFGGGEQVFTRNQTLRLARSTPTAPAVAGAGLSGPMTFNLYDQDGMLMETVYGAIDSRDRQASVRERLRRA